MSTDEPVRRTLVLGGARSGKSGHAESLLSGCSGVRYLATGRRSGADADWDDRIDRHRATRPPEWATVEVARHEDLAEALGAPGPILLDDMGTWLTGALDDLAAWDAPRGAVSPAVDRLVDAVAHCPGPLVIVSPEVGMSVVPSSRAGRLFRDEIGVLNARLAAVCDEVTLVIAGIASPLKRSRGVQ